MATSNLDFTEIPVGTGSIETVISDSLEEVDNEASEVADVDIALGGTVGVASSVTTRAKVLRMVNDPAAPFTLEVPAKKKFFALINPSTSSITVQVVGGGGVSAALAAASNGLYYTDGIDVYKIA